MKSNLQNQNQKGFSLVEVVITLFMIGVTLMLFQATANSVVLNKYGRYREIALRIADQKVQTVRTTSFASIPSSGSFSDPRLSSIPSGQATMTVNDVDDNLKDITVEVSWRSPKDGSMQEIELQTFVYSGGLGQ